MEEVFNIVHHERRGIQVIQPYNQFVIKLNIDDYEQIKTNLIKPFDKNFAKAMCMVSNDLINKFGCVTSYNFNDEINLIFNKECTHEEYQINQVSLTHMKKGISEKIAQVISTYCSVKFNYHLSKIILELISESDGPDDILYSEEFLEKIQNFEFTFSISVYEFDDTSKIYSYIVSRSIQKCVSESIKSLGEYYLGEIPGKNLQEIIEELKFVKVDLQEIPEYVFIGFCGKKVITQESETKSSSVIFRGIRIDEITSPVRILLEKTWENYDYELDIDLDNLWSS